MPQKEHQQLLAGKPSTCRIAMSPRFSVTDMVKVEIRLNAATKMTEVSSIPTVIFSILIAAKREP
ncbi:MAG: hypothetical protein CM15mP103_10340 [Gammaproteobacteria bacterium]|nr:MAG: hypothetical protein CM15mP103_10340 [Gammaproteobacteria bacterium]